MNTFNVLYEKADVANSLEGVYRSVAEALGDVTPLGTDEVEQFFTLVKESVFSDRMKPQIDALRTLSSGDDYVIIKLIEEYGAIFHDIIEDFTKRLGRNPTGEDLIWIAGVYTNKNPRDVAKEILRGKGDHDA